MALPFPNVPNLPGVPQVPRNPLQQFPAPSFITGDNLNGFPASSQNVWGVFDDNGNLIIQADSFVGLEYTQGSSLSDFPLERGAFESYDKVQTPFEIKVRLSKGGAVLDRQTFLDSLDAVVNDTNLYSVTTPEKTYVSVNIVNVNYRRECTRGMGLIVVELTLEEVRVNTSAAFSNATVESPAGADPESNGIVQPQTPPPVLKNPVQ